MTSKLSELKLRLITEKESLLKYLVAKFQNSDWHGVQDAASDLRDIDCQLEVIEMVEKDYICVAAAAS